MKIELISDLPHDFSVLETESVIAGFKFLEKLRVEWNSGKNRFNKTNEALYGIFENNKLVAIGGINIDPYTNDNSTGRLRHLYVLKDYRRHGLGANLVKKILEDSSSNFSKVRLRTDTITAATFYEKIGFEKINDKSATHQWIFGPH